MRHSFLVWVVLIAIGTCLSGQSPSNESLVAGSTSVRAVHITDLRTQINALREIAGLDRYAFTDPNLLAGGTVAKALHIIQLRSALADVFAAAHHAAPRYAEIPTAHQTLIRVDHINELRTSASIAAELFPIKFIVEADPPLIASNVQTLVIIAAQLSDRSVAVPTRPQLIEVSTIGQANIDHGLMYDDGTNGDAQSNDGIFTTQIALLRQGPSAVLLQVRAEQSNGARPIYSSSIELPVFTPTGADEARTRLASALRTGHRDSAYELLGSRLNAQRALDRMEPGDLKALGDALSNCTTDSQSADHFVCGATMPLRGTSVGIEFIFIRTTDRLWKLITW